MLATLDKIRELDSSVKITLIYDDRLGIDKNKYNIDNLNVSKCIARSKFTFTSIVKYIVRNQFSIIYVPGWQDRNYFFAAIIARTFSKTKLVIGFDDIYYGTTKQRIGSVIFRILFKSFFSKAWVSGAPQQTYAQIFGFPFNKIIYRIYSADSKAFSGDSSCSKRLVFYGRFVKEKNLSLLLKGFDALDKTVRGDWRLVLIGDGSLKEELKCMAGDGVDFLDYLERDALAEELKKGGVGVVPSITDQWGLPVHEFCCLGFPILVSDGVGAASQFAIHKYNAYVFNNSSLESIINGMKYFFAMPENELKLFKERSRKLSNTIDTELSAASLLSVL